MCHRLSLRLLQYVLPLLSRTRHVMSLSYHVILRHVILVSYQYHFNVIPTANRRRIKPFASMKDLCRSTDGPDVRRRYVLAIDTR